MFESRKLSPKLCISALPSHLPVVQRSQRTCFTAAFPLAQPGRAPSLFLLTLCPHWGDTLGTGSVSLSTTTRRTSQKEPFVAGTQAQEQLSQQLPQSLCMGIAATPVTGSPLITPHTSELSGHKLLLITLILITALRAK